MHTFHYALEEVRVFHRVLFCVSALGGWALKEGSCFPAQPEKPTTLRQRSKAVCFSVIKRNKGLLNMGLQVALCDPRAILVQRRNSLVKFCHLVKHFTTK